MRNFFYGIILFLPTLLVAEFSINDDFSFSSSRKGDNTAETSPYVDLRADNRLIAVYSSEGFKSEIHWLLNVNNYQVNPYSPTINLVIKDDRHSLFRLYKKSDGSDMSMINKIDRLNFSIFNDYYQFTLGRTALTWSRGRIFHVSDLFNAQNPGFYDGSYKIGTDMAVLNVGMGQEDSVSLVAAPRRDELGQLTSKDSTIALKYSHSTGVNDYSIIIARYLRDKMFSGGMSIDFLGGSVLRSDIVFWDLENKDTTDINAVLGVEKSFLLLDRSVTLYSEYYHNSMGSAKFFDQGILQTMSNGLMKRVANQDTSLFGRDYLGFGGSMELSTYTSLSYMGIMNLYDKSSMHMISLGYSYSESITLSGSLLLPYGGTGDEFGKICPPVGASGRCLQAPPTINLGLIYNL